MNGGRITHSSITLDDLHAHLKITYTGARGTGPDSGGDPPVFHLPVGIDYTIPGEIPIYIKVQTALLVKLGLSSKNPVLRGGVEYDSAGTDAVTQNGSSVSGSGSGSNPKGEILDAGNGGTGASTALGAGGVVVAVQFPKIGPSGAPDGVGAPRSSGLAGVRRREKVRHPVERGERGEEPRPGQRDEDRHRSAGDDGGHGTQQRRR